MDAEDAFLGSRWSVWEVLKHLDAESFVEALEQIAAGERAMLPPFTSREERLRQDIEHLEATYDRLKAVIEGLSEEPLKPGQFLPRSSRVERSSGHPRNSWPSR